MHQKQPPPNVAVFKAEGLGEGAEFDDVDIRRTPARERRRTRIKSIFTLNRKDPVQTSSASL
jgi:hypothetical protein